MAETGESGHDDLDAFIADESARDVDFVVGILRAERRHRRRLRWGRVLHLVRWHGWCLPRRCRVSARYFNELESSMREAESFRYHQAEDKGSSCTTSPASSRVCEQGAKGCVIAHENAAAKVSDIYVVPGSRTLEIPHTMGADVLVSVTDPEPPYADLTGTTFGPSVDGYSFGIFETRHPGRVELLFPPGAVGTRVRVTIVG